MKIAVYPGSFNPWHDGHTDIVEKALKVFDKVIIAQGINPDKLLHEVNIPSKFTYGRFGKKISVAKFRGLLVDFVKDKNVSAIIRGLRNGSDFEFEKVQQYWNEDLGLEIPTVYFISDRKNVHISSSALRQIQKIRPE